jgi:hypothetical protein
MLNPFLWNLEVVNCLVTIPMSQCWWDEPAHRALAIIHRHPIAFLVLSNDIPMAVEGT